MNLETDNIKKLIKVLSDNNLSEISIEDKDEKTGNKQAITIRRNPVAQEIASFSLNDTKSIEAEETEKNCENRDDAECGKPIVSPMTGTFYVSSAPDREPYVKLGEIVSEGQTLCVVEAMKLMNEIEADVSGKITKICVQNGEAVESGQVLMYIE